MTSDNSPPLKLLILDLHYCCPWAFFCAHKRTSMIAERLGVERRTVRKHKQRFYDGEYKCERKSDCMKEDLLRLGKTRDQRAEPRTSSRYGVATPQVALALCRVCHRSMEDCVCD